MASGIVMNKNNFEITYEAPWGGINADAFAADIAENQFTTSNGIKIKQNVITTSMWNTVLSNVINFAHPTPGMYYTGIVYCNGILILFDNSSTILHYDPTLNIVHPVAAVGSGFVFTCYKVINNQIYIFSFDTGTEIQYTPTSITTGTITFTPNPYVGGQYAAVLKNYLLTANSNQPTDDPAIKPARFSWSSPNAYLTFDPTVDRTAGFNVLGDVQDQITGLFIQGNVGYILRTQGITQFTPTGDPLASFEFDSMWSDDFGVGCDLPDTLSTYGALAIFSSSSGIFTFQSGSLTDISYGIKSLLQPVLQSVASDNPLVTSFVSATIYGSTQTDVASDINYALLIGQYVTGLALNPSFNATVYNYSVHNKCWTIQGVGLGVILASLFPSEFPQIISLPTFFKLFRAPKIQANRSGLLAYNRYISTKYSPYILASGNYGDNQYNIVIQLFDENPVNYQINSGGFTISFKLQEIKVQRQPTIRGILVRTFGSGTIHVNINSTSFTDIILDGRTTGLYVSNGVFTDRDPQLTLTSTDFLGTIAKVMIIGTFADGDII